MLGCTKSAWEKGMSPVKPGRGDLVPEDPAIGSAQLRSPPRQNRL